MEFSRCYDTYLPRLSPWLAVAGAEGLEPSCEVAVLEAAAVAAVPRSRVYVIKKAAPWGFPLGRPACCCLVGYSRSTVPLMGAHGCADGVWYPSRLLSSAQNVM